MTPTPVADTRPADGRPSLSSHEFQQWIARRQRFRRRVGVLCAIVLGGVVVSAATVWTIFHEQFAMRERLRSLGLTIDWEFNLKNFRTGGETIVSYIPHWSIHGPVIEPGALATVTRLWHVKTLEFSDLDLADDDLAFVAGLPDLAELYLGRPPRRGIGGGPPISLTDRVLDHLAGLSHLKTLTLSENRITDAGLAQLANLHELETLDLANTMVTDRGITALAGLKRLKILRLEGTPVTPEGAAAFQRLMPNVEVMRDLNMYNSSEP